MDGKDKSLLKLMDGSDNRFIIPVYQRNYDWGQPQCKQLYDDLVDIALNDRASHFFGCVVRAHAKNGSADEYLIINGQHPEPTEPSAKSKIDAQTQLGLKRWAGAAGLASQR